MQTTLTGGGLTLGRIFQLIFNSYLLSDLALAAFFAVTDQDFEQNLWHVSGELSLPLCLSLGSAAARGESSCHLQLCPALKLLLSP